MYKDNGNKIQTLKDKLYIIIFEADTKPGKLFDILLLICILVSVLAVILNSVEKFSREYKSLFIILEWCFTIIFTFEYLLRIYCAKNRLHYMKSFFGVIDLLAFLPNYVLHFIIGAPALTFIRVFRLLRVFAIFKLGRYIGEANFLLNALKSSFSKIVVFIGSVLTIVVIMGSVMFLIEGPVNGFVNIPKSMYWAIVTLTTVGYGDIAPQTVMGQTIASIIMLLGYGIIAIPTGILSAEIAIGVKSFEHNKVCSNCGKSGHSADARFCTYCGKEFEEKE
ncbi:MAG: ion transporter [Spirochaetales bacterium]|nr:ion transporter [Spirochaetales bacterium]